MRYAIIGYGNIGKKRKAVLGGKCTVLIDPINPEAQYKFINEVPVNSYDAAIVSTPNSVKIEILEYLLLNGKNALIEKPLLFSDYNIANNINHISIKNGVIWYTSYNHRFEPLIGKLKEYLESDTIGEVYFASFAYGNGTVQNIANTWRDVGMGVIDDLGCHLIDLVSFLFNKKFEYQIISSNNHEARVNDHCSFISTDHKITFTCSYLMWKNTFTIDVYGSEGSVHIDGLNKWGGASFIHRERIFPSGIPIEHKVSTSGTDDTWRDDCHQFERMISKQQNSFENDLMISNALNEICG
jgi:scyllo-inositol 2-dehydrogenase (NADP+)